MKKRFSKYVFRICIVLLGLSFSNDAQAQSNLTDTQLNDDWSIQLDSTIPLSDEYRVDVSHYASNMSDQQSADAFMDNFERDNVDIDVDYEKLVATIKLTFTSDNEDWTLEDWNEYLK